MDSYVGEIKIWPIAKAPRGWMICDGSLLTIRDYEMLYSLIGVTYGGDAVNNFALPDLRSRVPLHMGTGTGLTPRAIGSTGGSATVTVVEAQLPTHDHNVFAANADANSNTPTATASLGRGTGNVTIYSNEAATGTDFVMDGGALTSAGGNQAHPNVMPCLALNFIICVTAGVYPTQN